MSRASLLLGALCLACSKSEPPPPERTEPWPAQPVASVARGAEHRVKLRIDDRCDLRLELPAREATPRGNLQVARGTLELNLLDLEQSRGTIEVDVGSIVMDQEVDGSADTWDAEARAWLDVGANRPEAERERQRWAKYEITSISELSATAAHEGKRVPAAEAPDAAPAAEQRLVSATLTGQFSLHGFRLERSLRVRAFFSYAAAAVRGAVPSALRVELAKPLAVSLAAHDIQPRDATGVLVAQKTKWLGVRVGREARVNGWLSARSMP
jgi:hypothetical protein